MKNKTINLQQFLFFSLLDTKMLLKEKERMQEIDKEKERKREREKVESQSYREIQSERKKDG